MPLFLRAALFSIPRFIVIIAVVIGLNRLDVSPLPAWTVAILAYILHFVITFLFALWAMRKSVPTWLQVAGVTVILLILGVLWEIGLYRWMTGTSILEIIQGFTASSFYLIIIYALAIFAAGAFKRRRQNIQGAPEGLSV